MIRPKFAFDDAPPVWPGVVLSLFALVTSACALGQLITNTWPGFLSELPLLTYPELTLIPVLVYWVFAVTAAHLFASRRFPHNKVTSPLWALAWAILAGPVGFWLAGQGASRLYHLLCEAITAWSGRMEWLDRFINSYGVFILVCAVVLTFIVTSGAIAVTSWRLVKKLGKLAETRGGNPGFATVNSAIVASALMFPGMWAAANAVGSYRGFIVFLTLQCLGYLLAFLSLATIIRRLRSTIRGAGARQSEETQPRGADP